jgi:toxin ParE1/3/4
MARIVVTEHAKRDVREIISGLSRRAGHKVAVRYVAEFETAYGNLARFPDTGPLRPALGPIVRIKLVYPYVIVYDRAPEVVIVLRVLHGRRDIAAEFMRHRQP